MKVFKYPIELRDNQSVSMPVGAQILSVAEQHGSLCVWALVDETSATNVDICFYVRGTDHPCEGLGFALFLGTVLTHGGELVWHVFYGPQAS